MPKISGPTPHQLAQNLSQSKDQQTADLGLTLLIAYKILTGFALIPGVLGLRNSYGERHLTPDTAFFAFFLTTACAAGSVLAEGGGNYVPDYVHTQGTAVVGIAFWVLFVVMLLLRFLGIMHRRVRNVTSVHSFSDGTPRRFWYLLVRPLPYTVRDWCVRCVLEPGAVFVVGLALASFTGSRLIGLLGLLASFGFFLQQVMLQRELRAKYLDAMDAAIEAGELREDRARLQTGAEPDDSAAMTPPRARSALSTLDITRLRAARDAAQLPLPGVAEPAE
jgi:hypothetical protein